MINFNFRCCRPNPPYQQPIELLSTLSGIRGDLAALQFGASPDEVVIAYQPILTWTLYRAARGTLESELLAGPGILSPGSSAVKAEVSIASALDQWQALLDDVSLHCDAPEMMPPRWIGFISYSAGELLEAATAPASTVGHWPLMRWQLFGRYYVFNSTAQCWTLCALDHARDPGATQAMACMEETLQVTGNPPVVHPPKQHASVLMVPQQDRLADDIAAVQRYIAAGDIYQANLAVPWMVSTSEAPVAIYQRLSQYTGAPYSAFLRFANHHVICASPELFLLRANRRIRTEPIKGTRLRFSHNPVADQAQCRELLHSAKDQAELHMITDLLRNDLGKICEYGSVQVKEPRRLMAHSTVWHTNSTVVGTLREPKSGSGWASIIKAMCPGGSITGAPKIRAMQIIAALERLPRDLYCGNIGWINGTHGALNIAIRSIFMQGTYATVYAGAGIVADSIPSEETREMTAKARAPLAALGVTIE
jgi:anthranilate/para-aminobenzoate synthase component I